jgi:hypothetical protein
MITTRHIRHDYKTWVDWDQKTVRTLCGVTTQRRLAGIPGITEQPVLLSNGKVNILGWCIRCTNYMHREIIGLTPQVANTVVHDNYARAWAVSDKVLLAIKSTTKPPPS